MRPPGAGPGHIHYSISLISNVEGQIAHNMRGPYSGPEALSKARVDAVKWAKEMRTALGSDWALIMPMNRGPEQRLQVELRNKKAPADVHSFGVEWYTLDSMEKK